MDKGNIRYMEKKHLIMGTAGHVDHGKTSLIRALTGYDCDTHKQEKQRGITINLGFTNLHLPSGNAVGIVDVPGHADFINTMVSGACGIDFVLLVIAADEGNMPQTREHLQIMELLGIKKGIIVLNKTDLVEEELLELAEEEVRDLVSGTFLESAEIFNVSSITHHGIPELIEAIDKMIIEIPERDIEGMFRMYIDRIFTVEGFGVVVNGSVLNGKIDGSSPLYVLPGEREVRIRRMERHGGQVDSIQAGDRASLNLSGFRQKEFRRGMLLSEKKLEQSTLIDARITLFPSDRVISLWSQVIFLLGTEKQMARMHLLDNDFLEGGKEGLVQIYLPQPVSAVAGDRFVIRLSSGDVTLGGGMIIDPHPLHHRRRRKQQIEIVQKLSSGDLPEIIAAEVRKSVVPVTLYEIYEQTGHSVAKMTETVYNELPPENAFYQSSENIIVLQKKQKTVYQNKILNMLRKHHSENPLDEHGKNIQELMGIFGGNVNSTCKEFLPLLLQEMEEAFKIRKSGKTWVMHDHSVKISESFQKKIDAILDFLFSCGYNVPLMGGLQDAADDADINDKELKQILQKLIKDEQIVYYQNSYLDQRIVNQARAKLISFLKKNDDGIALAQFRDLLNTNRKMASLLLEYFDKQEVTVRRDNIRQFTPKFKKYLEN